MSKSSNSRTTKEHENKHSKGKSNTYTNEDVKHRVFHNMIKICYGLKGLYQVAGEERFWTLNLKEKIWKQN